MRRIRPRRHTANKQLPAASSKRETPSQVSDGALRENPGIFDIRVILFLLIIVCGKAWARDEFEGIKCGADIPKSLVGKRDSNERVAVIEERHKDLGLKDLGGTEISDRLFLVSWQICGSEYELLVNTKSELIRDVLPFPPHSATAPMFIGTCQADGKQIREAVVAVLDNSAGYNARDRKLVKTALRATAAWKIDETKEKFAKQSTENIGCPLTGIVTLDGGP
jgi:hypothetical protein